jgi:hypothetical protein
MGVVSYQNLSLKAFERQIMLALPIWLDRDYLEISGSLLKVQIYQSLLEGHWRIRKSPCARHSHPAECRALCMLWD